MSDKPTWGEWGVFVATMRANGVRFSHRSRTLKMSSTEMIAPTGPLAGLLSRSQRFEIKPNIQLHQTFPSRLASQPEGKFVYRSALATKEQFVSHLLSGLRPWCSPVAGLGLNQARA